MCSYDRYWRCWCDTVGYVSAREMSIVIAFLLYFFLTKWWTCCRQNGLNDGLLPHQRRFGDKALDNALLPDQHKAIIWTNADLLSNNPPGTNLSEIWAKIYHFSYKKYINLKISPAECLHHSVSVSIWQDKRQLVAVIARAVDSHLWMVSSRGRYWIMQGMPCQVNSLAPKRYSCNLKLVIDKVMPRIGSMGISWEITLRWMPQDLTRMITQRWFR